MRNILNQSLLLKQPPQPASPSTPPRPMLAAPYSSERPLNFGSFIAVALLHLLALQAIMSMAETAPAASADPPLYVEFITAPEPAPLQPPEPLPPSPPRPVERPKPKPLITSKATEPAPNAIEAPAEPAEPEPLPPIAAAPPPPGPATEPVAEPPKFDLAYLNNPAPDYPKAASRMGQEGRVLLDVRVSAEGTVISLRIKRSSGFPRLDEAALNAVRRWKFTPSRRGDSAIEGRAEVPVDFVLKK